jgi:hypothetical protein
MVTEDPLVQALPPSAKRQRVEDSIRICMESQQDAVDQVVAATFSGSQTDRDQVKQILRTCTPATAVERLTDGGMFPKAQALAVSNQVVSQTETSMSNSIKVPTIQESIQAAVTSEERADVAKRMIAKVIGQQETLACQTAESAIHTGIGQRLEARALDSFANKTQADITHRNVTGYSKTVDCKAGYRLVLYGKIDGKQGPDTVIEAKQRQYRLYRRLIEREKIQLYTYLYLTQCNTGVLVETYRREQKEHRVVFDKSVWQSYLDRIITGLDVFHKLVVQEDDTERVALIARCLH